MPADELREPVAEVELLLSDRRCLRFEPPRLPRRLHSFSSANPSCFHVGRNSADFPKRSETSHTQSLLKAIGILKIAVLKFSLRGAKNLVNDRLRQIKMTLPIVDALDQPESLRLGYRL